MVILKYHLKNLSACKKSSLDQFGALQANSEYPNSELNMLSVGETKSFPRSPI